MSFWYFDNFENMDSSWARDGMTQAAMDCVSGRLPSHAQFANCLQLIQQGCWFSLRPSAWVRGYLLIALMTDRIDLVMADKVCRMLKQPHWEIDHYPRKWLTRAQSEPTFWVPFVLNAATEAAHHVAG
jgi:hypothetical protein